jgi:hypothetical protein
VKVEILNMVNLTLQDLQDLFIKQNDLWQEREDEKEKERKLEFENQKLNNTNVNFNFILDPL